jgi:hypothetical protein
MEVWVAPEAVRFDGVGAAAAGAAKTSANRATTKSVMRGADHVFFMVK